jgi:hypothetical protein
MSMHKKMVVAVSVSTVWTEPTSPRPLDQRMLERPVDIKGWLESMTLSDKLDLYGANRIQTQVLYGTIVLVSETYGDWVKVIIPDQKTLKGPLGYLGWIPSIHLAEIGEEPVLEAWAEVSTHRALLYANPTEPRMELSFLTRLPIAGESGEFLKVHTPDGLALIKKKDMRIVGNTLTRVSEEEYKGQLIVNQGLKFLGLPYLWGGMSSFGYDCSGFVYNMHKFEGILLPRDTSDQSREGIMIDLACLEPGDLLFFARDVGKGPVHHVGMYAGGRTMIHSPETGSCIEIVNLEGYKLANELCVARRYWA